MLFRNCRSLRIRCGESLSVLHFVSTIPVRPLLRVYRCRTLRPSTRLVRLLSGSVIQNLTLSFLVRTRPRLLSHSTHLVHVESFSVERSMFALHSTRFGKRPDRFLVGPTFDYSIRGATPCFSALVLRSFVLGLFTGHRSSSSASIVPGLLAATFNLLDLTWAHGLDC